MDVGGLLALMQTPIENFRRQKPHLVSRITFQKAAAPELPGKLRAQQDAGRVDIDLVLTGDDALSVGIEQKLWLPVAEAYSAALPKLDGLYVAGADRLQKSAGGQGVVVAYYPGGPLLEYMPDRVKTVPGTAQELLDWARQNSGKFMYARPANSGPGKIFLMGMPYILGDADPRDPVKGWDKTWAYLKELGKHIEYYPAGTGTLMKEFGEGSRDIIATTTGWDINPRALGIVPKEARIATLEGFHWVTAAQFMAVPKGVPDDKLAVVLDLIGWCLRPDQQAYAFDQGYYYPGPAVQGVTLDMAPADSQQALREFGRPEYDALIANHPLEIALDPPELVHALRRWDADVAGSGR